MLQAISKVFLKMTALFAVFQAVENVNAACCLILYEPEMPESIKDMVR